MYFLQTCTEEQLLPFFETIGKVAELVIVRDKVRVARWRTLMTARGHALLHNPYTHWPHNPLPNSKRVGKHLVLSQAAGVLGGFVRVG